MNKKTIVTVALVAAPVLGVAYLAGVPGEIIKGGSEAYRDFSLGGLDGLVTNHPYIGAGVGMLTGGLLAASRMVTRFFSKPMLGAIALGTAAGILDRFYMFGKELGPYGPLSEVADLGQLVKDTIAVGFNVAAASAYGKGIGSAVNALWPRPATPAVRTP